MQSSSHQEAAAQQTRGRHSYELPCVVARQQQDQDPNPVLLTSPKKESPNPRLYSQRPEVLFDL